MAQDYFFDSPDGDYDWNIHTKCREAIGREPIGRRRVGSGVEAKMVLTFDPALSTGDETLITAIFATPGTACDAIVESAGMSYEIKDLYEALGDIETEIGFPMYITYRKSAPELDRCDIIRLTFGGMLLTAPQKNSIASAIDDLILGWV